MKLTTGDPIDLGRLRCVHLVGIGGMHMSAIASLLLARGIRVTGSDLALSPYTSRLASEGATIYEGHDAAHLGEPDLVVATVAARETNPELVAAHERGIPVAIRAEMVAALMEGRTAVCVAGTHGKTTTSSLIAFALTAAGRDPTYLLGGDSVDLGRNAAPGNGAAIVVEADEYAEAFLHYHPDLALVTNVEVDHLDYYKTESRLLKAFGSFLGRVRPAGLSVVCADSSRLRALVAGEEAPGCRIETYGLDSPADWTATIVDSGYPQSFNV
ncbi:MAG: UDP-N-acetylmuramate--L-alanine ligase, partial [Dehalococcoidia bacterium]